MFCQHNILLLLAAPLCQLCCLPQLVKVYKSARNWYGKMARYSTAYYLKTIHRYPLTGSWFSSTRIHLALRLLGHFRYHHFLLEHRFHYQKVLVISYIALVQVPQVQPESSARTLLPMVLFQNVAPGPPNTLLQVAVKNSQQPVWYFNDKISLLVLFTEDGRMERTSFLEVTKYALWMPNNWNHTVILNYFDYYIWKYST